MMSAGEQPVLSRDPASLPGELPRGADLPGDHDPLAEGVLMAHQADWLADLSDLKAAAKGRRTGITYAEALDSAMTAASARSAGGQNVFYIGDTKDKGREYIGYVAHFARVVSRELASIEEFLFEDVRDDGSSKMISAYRVRFASGFRVEALSSRPENIRGLQGTVVIDEAAFHQDVRGVLDAVNALLIWGGKIRVISSHNGVLNPFNELIREAEAGKIPFSVHHIPFGMAVANGLYRRVCLMTGKTWSPEAEAAWEGRIRAAYGARTSAMRQELDAIPADAVGAALTRVQIEAATLANVPIGRLTMPDEAKSESPERRSARAREWCEQHLAPVLKGLPKTLRHVAGQDFARTGDVSAIIILSIEPDTARQTRLVVEMRNVPFDQQREILFYILERLPRFSGIKLDATGNGAYLAEVTAQKFGGLVEEVKLSREWYAKNGTPYVDAIAGQMMGLPADEDIITDHQALQFVDRGIIKVPDGHRLKGTDGEFRHGDTAIAGMLAYAASRDVHHEYAYTPATPQSAAADGDDDDDEGGGFVMRTLRRIRGAL